LNAITFQSFLFFSPAPSCLVWHPCYVYMFYSWTRKLLISTFNFEKFRFVSLRFKTKRKKKQKFAIILPEVYNFPPSIFHLSLVVWTDYFYFCCPVFILVGWTLCYLIRNLTWWFMPRQKKMWKYGKVALKSRRHFPFHFLLSALCTAALHWQGSYET